MIPRKNIFILSQQIQQLSLSILTYICLVRHMIIKIIQSILTLFFFFVAYKRYLFNQESSHLQSSPQPFTYDQYSLKFSSIWNNQQFNQSPITKLFFQVSKADQTLVVKTNKGDVAIRLKSLGMDEEDALLINYIGLVEGAQNILMISSKFYDIAYELDSSNICYSRVGENMNNEKIFYLNHNLWVFTVASHNVLIHRVFSCGSEDPGKMIYSHKYLPPSRLNFIKEVLMTSDSKLKVQCLATNRNEYHYTFVAGTFQLEQRTIVEAFDFTHVVENVEKVSISLSSSIKEIQISAMIDEVIYELTFGHYGRKPTNRSGIVREKQSFFDVEFLDTQNNMITKMRSEKKELQVTSLDEVLVPFRTPIFMSKKSQENMPVIDYLFENVASLNDKKFNIKFEEIATGKLVQLKDLLGIYWILPDSAISFLAINSQMLNFYPIENLKPQEYTMTRTAKGGVVFQGNKIKGMHSQLQPYLDTSDPTLKFGRASTQVYQELTSNGIELLPGVFEVHALYKSLFLLQKKNRVELIQGLNGKPALTHYLNQKEGYELSSVKLQNNEFWVFEHHSRFEKPNLITKYELFFNGSAHKTILSIKRTYNMGIEGKIISIQKCIDTFYYFQSIAGDKYIITRIHQAKLSNRQRRPDGKYAGAFEQSMILQKLEKNTKFLISPLQQQPFSVSLHLGKSILNSWVKMEHKHQYQIFPYRVYYEKESQKYFVLNLRKLCNNAYDQQTPRITDKFRNVTSYILAGLSVACFASLFVPTRPKNKTAQQKPPKPEKKQKASYQSVDYKKDQ